MMEEYKKEEEDKEIDILTRCFQIGITISDTSDNKIKNL